MFVPETTLLNFLNSLVSLVNTDWANYTNKQLTILYLLMNEDDNLAPLALDNFNFYNQAINVFIKDASFVRQLGINLGYNTQRLGPPTIHILLPNESPANFEGIGEGQGYVAETYDNVNNLSSLTLTSTFSATYNLMITSDNSVEVVLIYHFFRALLELFKVQLTLMGFLNLKISGADIQLQSDLVPSNIFHRNMMLNFEYESSFKKLFTPQVATSVKAALCSNFYLDYINNLKNQNRPGYEKA